MITAIVVNL